MKSVLIGFLVTFFRVFDVPVFWPILLLYWFILFFLTMKRQIRHMIKYKYIPFSFGKKVRACSHRATGQPVQRKAAGAGRAGAVYGFLSAQPRLCSAEAPFIWPAAMPATAYTG